MLEPCREEFDGGEEVPFGIALVEWLKLWLADHWLALALGAAFGALGVLAPSIIVAWWVA